MAGGALLFHPAEAGAPVPPSVPRKDARLSRLQKFFKRYNCPVGRLAPSFIRASDRHRIDWRLLPSLALVESGCGRESYRNNIFGWGNGTVPFRSVEAGIHLVAERLANSEYYRGKSLEDVLVTYNPVPGYVDRVQMVMSELGSTPFTPAIAD